MAISKQIDPTAQIVDAASKLFAEQGYHATTTRQIARMAELSENTLFRHFDHKEDMFWAALDTQLRPVKLRGTLAIAIAERQAPEVVIRELSERLIKTTASQPYLVRLIAIAFLELGGKASGICNAHLAPIFELLGDYFEECIRTGRMRNLDPKMLMVALSSTIIVHPLLLQMSGIQISTYPDQGAAIAACTKFWVEVLSPPAVRDHHG